MIRRAVSPRAQAHCQSVATASCHAVVAAFLSLLVTAAAAEPLPDCAGCDPRDRAACALRYGAAGTVIDALTGEPIAGATVTVLDLQGVSAADGWYRVEGTRTTQCHIDYFYTLIVSAPGYEPFDLQLYANHTFVEMPIELLPEGAGFTVSGTVAEFLPCSGRMRGVTVVLEPLGLMTTTSLGPDGGEFTFANVPPGDYTVRVSPACSQLDGCWRETEFIVSASDVSLNVCLEPDEVEPSPTACPVATPCGPGSVPRPCLEQPCGLNCGCEPCPPCGEGETHALANACDCVPGSADGTRTPTHTPAQQPSESTRTPTHTPPHQPSVMATPTEVACAGDCDGNGAVGIEELIAAVGRALGVAAASGGCDSFDRDRDGSVAINDLIALVATALEGCAPRS